MGVKKRPCVLTVEAGHSAVHLTLFKKQDLTSKILPLGKGFSLVRVEREVAHFLEKFKVEKIAGTSVNKKITQKLHDLLKKYSSGNLLWFASSAEIPLKIHYNSEQLGTDRALAAIAAYDYFKTSCVIVDLGSAFTVDGVDEKGAFVGGLIFPGPAMMLDSFRSKTGLETPANLTIPENSSLSSTKDALNSGLYYGYTGALNRLIWIMLDKVGTTNLILTGGWAPLFFPILEYRKSILSPPVLDEQLVARGLYLCALKK